jgi:hypothetical protein
VTALFEAVDVMIEQQRILAALILLHSGIDAMASLESRSRERN